MRYKEAPEPISISDFPRALLEAVYTEGYNRDLDYPPEDETVQQALHRMGIMADIACAMSAANLSERETNVIVRRYMLGEDLIAIGQAYGVTRERVRRKGKTYSMWSGGSRRLYRNTPTFDERIAYVHQMPEYQPGVRIIDADCIVALEGEPLSEAEKAELRGIVFN